MGAAAYNRGSQAIRDQIDREQPSVELQLLRDLSAYSATCDGKRLFCETVVRFHPRTRVWHLMHRPDRGWGEFSEPYDNLWTLARKNQLVFLAWGQDEHSRFVRVVPGKEA